MQHFLRKEKIIKIRACVLTVDEISPVFFFWHSVFFNVGSEMMEKGGGKPSEMSISDGTARESSCKTTFSLLLEKLVLNPVGEQQKKKKKRGEKKSVITYYFAVF